MESEYSDPGLRQKRRISSSNPMTSWQKADTFPFMLSYISIIGKGEWRQMLDTLRLRMFQFFTVDNCVWWMRCSYSIRYNRIWFYESFLPPVESSPIQTKVVANLTKLLSWICLSPFLSRFTTLIALCPSSICILLLWVGGSNGALLIYLHFQKYLRVTRIVLCWLLLCYVLITNSKKRILFICHFLRINLNKNRKKLLWRFYSVTFFTRLRLLFNMGKYWAGGVFILFLTQF